MYMKSSMRGMHLCKSKSCFPKLVTIIYDHIWYHNLNLLMNRIHKGWKWYYKNQFRNYTFQKSQKQWEQPYIFSSMMVRSKLMVRSLTFGQKIGQWKMLEIQPKREFKNAFYDQICKENQKGKEKKSSKGPFLEEISLANKQTTYTSQILF